MLRIHTVHKNTSKYRSEHYDNKQQILEQYREELEQRIKDLFIWALGESAITERTKTVRDNDTNRMDINQLYSLFQLHFISERNKFHSRGQFFEITREKKTKQPAIFGCEYHKYGRTENAKT